MHCHKLGGFSMECRPQMCIGDSDNFLTMKHIPVPRKSQFIDLMDPPRAAP